jgi:hypothetical protein
VYEPRRVLVHAPHRGRRYRRSRFQHNVIARNTVHGNRGTTILSGGIVLDATTRANADETFAASTGSAITHNHASHNRPADIVEDDASTANVITGNRCHTSIADGLCHHS